MNIVGIGGPELLLIAIVALFILGPRRLLRGLQDFKRFYSEFKRRRDEFTSMVSESVEAETIRKEIVEPATKGTEEIREALSIKPEEFMPDLSGKPKPDRNNGARKPKATRKPQGRSNGAAETRGRAAAGKAKKGGGAP